MVIRGHGHSDSWSQFAAQLSGDSDSKESAGDSGSIPRSKDPMEKGRATHFSILAWRIPWTEDPGEL